MQTSTVAIRFLSTDTFAYECTRDNIREYIGGLTYDLNLDEPFATACAMMCNDMGLDYEDTNFVYESRQAVADHHTPDMIVHTDVITLYCYSQKALGVPTVAIRFLYTEMRGHSSFEEYMGDYISGLKYDLKLGMPFTRSCKWICDEMGWNYDD